MPCCRNRRRTATSTALAHAGVPGTYLFHVGEECGCVGARHVATTRDLSRYRRAIEFDRRGTRSVITHMLGERTCSQSLANALASQLGLGFTPDDTGSTTDVYEYASYILEVTNLSCGYENPHCHDESIRALWLINELIPALYTVNWEALPVVRVARAKRAVHDVGWP